MTRRRHVVLLCAAALAGCAVPPAADPPMAAFLIDQVPRDVPRGGRSSQTLVVFPPDARPAIDTMQMAYLQQPHQIAYYAHHQWAETPAQMLQPLLLRTLEATGAFRAVVRPPITVAPSLSLRTEIIDLVQDYGASPPVVRLALRVQLVDDRTRAVLGTREITAQETMEREGPQAGVVAANAAVARALRDVAQFAIDATR